MATDALSFIDALKLVQIRGEAMHNVTEHLELATKMSVLVVAPGKLQQLRAWCADKDARELDLRQAEGMHPEDFFALSNINSVYGFFMLFHDLMPYRMGKLY